MKKSEQPKAAARKRPGAVGRPAAPLVAFTRATLTISFDSEQDLLARLRAVLAWVEAPEPARALAASVAASAPCLTMFASVDVVTDALEGQRFDPSEKLGDTYLLPQERELFQARVVNEVRARGCNVAVAAVPAGEDTTHGDVVLAVRDNANHLG